MKIYTYHTSHSFKTKDGASVSFLTQLYKTGVYGIANNDSALQGNFTPGQIVLIEKRIKKQEAAGNITDLQFGRQIKVSDKSGFWEEVP